jgi:hypothetical protein
MRRRFVVPLILLSVVLSGCSALTPTSYSGTPTRKTLPPLPPTTTVSLPSRPKSIPLTGLNACKILTTNQRSQLGLDRGPLPDTERGFGDAPTCSFRNATAQVATRLALVTVSVADVWLSEQAGVIAESITVGGFGALIVKNPQQPAFCNVEVDVAQGQFLDVLYRDDGSKPPAAQDTLCKGAQRIAEAAMTSLNASTSK